MFDKIMDRFSGTPAAAAIDGAWTGPWNKASRFLYQFLNARLRDRSDVCFFNYGYAPLDDHRIPLQAADEPNRMYIHLYHAVAARAALLGRDVLEVSCGRGGGAKYLKQYLQPKTLCGMDRAMRAVSFCGKHHVEDGLRFVCGDAQALPFKDHSFDAVVNIEASHDYLNLDLFLGDVARVLRPGGCFLYADFRKPRHLEPWRRQIISSGLKLVEEEDITPNVIRGLELNTDHNLSLVKKLAPWALRPILLQFAGVKGSHVYKAFKTGANKYLRYMLRKPH